MSGDLRASVALPFGVEEAVAALPDGWGMDLIASLGPGDLPDPDAVLDEALNHPLHSRPPEQLLSRRGRVVLAAAYEPDWPGGGLLITRLVSALRRRGIGADRLHLLIASGQDALPSREAIQGWLGEKLSAGLAWSLHDPDGPSRPVGATAAGTPVEFDAKLFDCDLLIPLGRVRQHPLAGFSGVPGLLFPGLASRRSRISTFGAVLAGDGGCTWRAGVDAGRLRSNPLQQDMLQACALYSRPQLALSCIAGTQPDSLAGLWVGELRQSHLTACRTFLGWKTHLFETPYDLVLSASGGAPGDGLPTAILSDLLNAGRLLQPDGVLIHLAAGEVCSAGQRSWPASADGPAWRELARTGDALDRLVFSLRAQAHGRRLLLVSGTAPAGAAALGLEPAAGLSQALSRIIPGLPAGHRTALFPDAASVFPCPAGS